MESKQYLLGTFIAACVALVICFTMPFVEVEDKDEDDGSVVTLTALGSIVTAQAQAKFDSYDREIERINENDDYGWFYDSKEDAIEAIEEAKEDAFMDNLGLMLSGFAALLPIICFAVIMALSAYLLGGYGDIKKYDLHVLMLKLLSFAPAVVICALVYLTGDTLKDHSEYEYSSILVIIVSFAVAICGLLFNPKSEQ